MQRIVIIGCSGSGKSTLARALGERLRLPVTHLDSLYWQPGWQPHPDMEAFQARIREIAAGERWIIDGGYISGNAEARYGRADTCVLFDLPTWLCLSRVIWRTIKYRGQTRPDLGADCREGQFDPEFLNYVRTYRRAKLPQREEEIAKFFRGRLIRLSSPKEVDAFLASLPSADRMNA